MGNNKWSNLPKNCPPTEAIEANNTVYRLVFDSSITKNDFQMWINENPLKKEEKEKNKKQWCQSHAISVFSSSESLKEKWKKHHNIRRKFKGIAKGYLSKKHGYILQTGRDPKHYSFWKYNNIPIHQEFTLVFTDK